MNRKYRLFAGCCAVAGLFMTGMATETVQASPASGVAADTQYDQAQLRHDVDAVQATGVTGVLAEVDGGRWEARAGSARTGNKQPVPLDSEIRIGSATKTFVATVILQLVAEHRLTLDDTVDHWLPGVITGNGNDGRKITIRELLRHTSGIPDFTDDMAQIFATPQDYYQHRLSSVSPTQLVELALRHPPLFPPGSGWSYSGTNYVLLGMIIKQVTGSDWAREVTDRIIDPLGLSHTFVPGTQPNLDSPHADLYQQFDPDGPLIDTTVFNMTWADAAGAVVSTPDDLDRFFRALVGGQLLPSTQLAAMEQTVPTPGQLSFIDYGFGLGWQSLPCGGGYWTHDGDVFGSSTIDGITPDGRHSVVVETFTELAGDGPAIAQRKAGYQLLDNALCDLSR